MPDESIKASPVTAESITPKPGRHPATQRALFIDTAETKIRKLVRGVLGRSATADELNSLSIAVANNAPAREVAQDPTLADWTLEQITKVLDAASGLRMQETDTGAI